MNDLGRRAQECGDARRGSRPSAHRHIFNREPELNRAYTRHKPIPICTKLSPLAETKMAFPDIARSTNHPDVPWEKWQRVRILDVNCHLVQTEVPRPATGINLRTRTEPFGLLEHGGKPVDRPSIGEQTSPRLLTRAFPFFGVPLRVMGQRVPCLIPKSVQILEVVPPDLRTDAAPSSMSNVYVAPSIGVPGDCAPFGRNLMRARYLNARNPWANAPLAARLSTHRQAAQPVAECAFLHKGRTASSEGVA